MTIYLGSNIQYLRKKYNIEQEKLAEDLNIPRSTLSCWENGLRTPKIETIEKIANYFNVNMNIITKDFSNIEINNNNYLINQLENNIDKISVDDKNFIKQIIDNTNKDGDDLND